jgi:hypothetical protein
VMVEADIVVYGDEGRKLYVLQQRSPCLKVSYGSCSAIQQAD